MSFKNIFLAAVWLLGLTSNTHAQGGDQFRILNDEYNALTVRYNLLQQAKSEILFSTFIIKDDAIGHANLKVLADAAARGVKVSMLLDDMGNKVPVEMLEYLVAQGVEVKLFNRRNWRNFNSFIRRMHGKMLIVDNTFLLVGGRNVDNEYFRMDSTSNFLDREVLIRGDRAVSNARQHFMAMWEHEQISQNVERKPLTIQQQNTCAHLMDTAMLVLKTQLPRLKKLRIHDTLSEAANNKLTINKVNFIHPNFTFKQNGKLRRSKRNDRRTTEELLELIHSANKTIDIEAAYFLPTKRWMKALRAAHRRGVHIRVMTNSAVSNDVPMIQAVYSNRRGKYRRAGIELYEYCGDRMVHIKAITIDTQIAVIGSYNIERKSEKFNTEVMAWVNDPNHAQLQHSLFERNLKRCVAPNGSCPEQLAPPSDIQRKRQRKVRWLRFTIAPIAGLFF